MARKKIHRQCLPCTVCCEGWLQVEVLDYKIREGNPCPIVGQQGCTQYETRPDVCKSFECGWVADDSPLPDWLRPDNAKVIFIPDKAGWQGTPVDMAVPVGRKITPRALNWLRNFAEQRQRPIVFLENIKEDGKYTGRHLISGHGPDEFQKQLQYWMENNIRFWKD